MRSLHYLEWNPDTSAICGDPRFIAESVLNAASYMGLGPVVGLSLGLYLLPLLLIATVTSITYYAKRKLVLLAWPDVFLLVLPAAIWLLLALAYPVGKPYASLLDLLFLGLLAGLTLIVRSFGSESVRTPTAKLGLLGVTSAAICCWAFMPEWTVFS